MSWGWRVFFGVLGGLEVRRDGESVPIDRPRRRALLAYLLLNADRTVTNEQIVEAVWGEAAPATVRTQIHVAVSELRRSLAGDRIATRDGGYQLGLGADELDLAVFRRLAAQEATLREALGLWRGQALADIDAPFVAAVRVALDEERLAAWKRLSDVELAAGSHHALIPELTALLAEYPLREWIAERLMLALYRDLRQADALEVARSMRRRLAEELGIDPSRSLLELEQAVLRAEPSLDLPKTPVAPAVLVPAQLPPDVPDFTGRERQLRQLDEVQRAVAVVGSGGMGKTTLAVHWAHRVRGRFPDGQLYVNMQGYEGTPVTPARALAGFLHSLGVGAERVPTDTAEATALFRSVLDGKRMLVIVDNVSAADQVRPLLPATGECAVVITSRDRLTGLAAVDGVTRLELDTLSASDAQTLMAKSIGDARAIAEPQALAALAQLCGHLPLALRIAAAQLADYPDQTIAGYVAELHEGDLLSALDIPGDAASSVRGTFALSYRRLDQAEQRMFRLLALVPGEGFGIGAAAALAQCDKGTARRTLDRLATVHLLQRLPAARFQFHDLLRRYATSLVQNVDPESERRQAIARLLDFYVATSDAATRRFYPGGLRMSEAVGASTMDSAEAGSWLEHERDCLITAALFAAEHAAEHGHSAWQLLDTLRSHLYVHRFTREVLTLGEAALVAAEALGHKQAQALAQMSIGLAYTFLNDARQGVTRCQIALRLAREAGWTSALSGILNNTALAHMLLGDLRPAHAVLSEAVELFEVHDDPARRPIVLSNLGLVEHLTGRSQVGERMVLEAFDLYRVASNVPGQVEALAMNGIIALETGQAQRAYELAETAIELLGSDCGKRFETIALGLMGDAELALGRTDAAHRTLSSSLQIAVDLGEQFATAEMQIKLARVELSMGNCAAAQALAQTALTTADAHGYRLIAGYALLVLAQAAAGDSKVEYANKALTVLRQCGDVVKEAEVRALLQVCAHP